MSNVFNMVSEDTYVEQTNKMAAMLAAIASNGGNGSLAIKNFKDVQQIVRMGLGKTVFNIGDQFVVEKANSELVFDVIGIDHDTPSDSQFVHSLTLQLHGLCQNIQFDSQEAMYYCENELPAGTYNFTLLANYDTAYGGGKTYQFTTTQAVPVGGQIMFPWGDNQQAVSTKISTYISADAATPIETVSVTEGSGGTSLGTADGTSNMNHAHRLRYGSSKWSDSDLRMWLNSTEPVGGNVWERKTKFSHKPSWAATESGFLHGVDADFLAVLGSVKKTTALNTVTDGGGSEILNDKIFLLSRSEIFAGRENNIDEGATYPYYSNYSDLSSVGTGEDKNRIKYLSNGAAQYWWLRSPHTGYAYLVRRVDPSGALNLNIRACDSSGLAPACCIV